ncbi:hypothetical protein TRVL_03930 [Trypanosoma vivax]|nr:hypothetical protein TRVL_03930 [Trypanosoma vivax]
MPKQRLLGRFVCLACSVGASPLGRASKVFGEHVWRVVHRSAAHVSNSPILKHLPPSATPLPSCCFWSNALFESSILSFFFRQRCSWLPSVLFWRLTALIDVTSGCSPVGVVLLVLLTRVCIASGLPHVPKLLVLVRHAVPCVSIVPIVLTAS